MLCDKCEDKNFLVTFSRMGRGLGVFSKKTFEEGADLFFYYKKDEDGFRPSELLPVAHKEVNGKVKLSHLHVIGDAHDVQGEPKEDIVYRPKIASLGRLCSHACTGSKQENIKLRYTKEGGVLFALKKIKPGTELAWDYGCQVSEGDKRHECGCSRFERKHFIETINGSHF